MLGTRQHGLPEFRVARLPEDVELLVRARDRADQILIDDPRLEQPEHALLREAVGGTLRVRARPDSCMSDVTRLLDRGYTMIWREGRLEDALRGLEDDFEWVVPEHPEGAVRHGAEGVIEFFREWVEPWDDLELDWEIEPAGPDAALAMIDMRGADVAAACRPRCASSSSGPSATGAPFAWRCSATSTRRAARRGSRDGDAGQARTLLTRVWREHDVEGALADLPQDFEWLVPGFPGTEAARGPRRPSTSSGTGSTSGRPPVDWELEQTSPETVLAVVDMRGHGRASGVPVELRFAQIWTFRDGEPVRMVLYNDLDEGRRAAGLA